MTADEVVEKQIEETLRQFMKDCGDFEWETGLRRKFYGARDKLIKLISGVLVPQTEKCRHKWSRDGERCVKCGKKDWMEESNPKRPVSEDQLYQENDCHCAESHRLKLTLKERDTENQQLRAEIESLKKEKEMWSQSLGTSGSERDCGHFVMDVLSFCPVCSEISTLTQEKEALEARVKELELDLAHLNWICECKILHSNEESACPKCLCCNPGVGKIQALESKLEKAMDVVDYAMHTGMCILASRSAGRPTENGGYEMMYGWGERAKWYQTRPVDETPKCNCGLDDALTAFEQEGEKK